MEKRRGMGETGGRREAEIGMRRDRKSKTDLRESRKAGSVGRLPDSEVFSNKAQRLDWG